LHQHLTSNRASLRRLAKASQVNLFWWISPL
ncbi:tonB1 protein, partial [Vibrio cholerae HC-62B1]